MKKFPLFSIYKSLKRIENIALIHVHSYIYFYSLEAVFLGKWLNIPTLLTLHGGIQTKVSNSDPLAEKIMIHFKNFIFDKFFGRFILKRADYLTSVSKRDLLSINSQFHLWRERNYWIPNAVDIHKYPFYNDLERKKFITFIGRLTKIKGFDLFLKILNEVPVKILKEYKVLIVGKGSIELYKREINLLQQKHIVITHYESVEYSKISTIYQKSRVFVCPSRFEGLPTTILESLASGTIVLASTVGGIPEIIKNKQNGYAYPPFDIEKAKNYLSNILNPNFNSKYRKIALNGRKTIEKKYSWSQIAQKFIKLYNKIHDEFD